MTHFPESNLETVHGQLMFVSKGNTEHYNNIVLHEYWVLRSELCPTPNSYIEAVTPYDCI